MPSPVENRTNLPHSSLEPRRIRLEANPGVVRDELMGTMRLYLKDPDKKGQRLTYPSLKGLEDLAESHIAFGRHSLVDSRKKRRFNQRTEAKVSRDPAYIAEVGAVTQDDPLPTGENASAESSQRTIIARPALATSWENEQYDHVAGFFGTFIEPELRKAEKRLLEQRLEASGIENTLTEDEVNAIVHIRMGKNLQELGSVLYSEGEVIDDNMARAIYGRESVVYDASEK